jgi:hypothetical protein
MARPQNDFSKSKTSLPGGLGSRLHTILAHENRPDEDVLDEVYGRFAQSDPFLPITHFNDHATMGPEALVGLGMGGRVEKWISRHRVRPYKAPTKGNFDPLNWKAALGKRDAHGDWLKYFETELEKKALRDVLSLWVPRFAHDVGALLFHGLIRTAHAVRALEHKDTPVRRGEVARGLALWAIGIRTAPSETAKDPFREVDVATGILRFAAVGSAVLITDPNVPNVHLVTGPMAYMMISQHLDQAAHETALASFARTHARAVRSFESLRPKTISEPIPSLDKGHFEALSAQTDAHPIKLTEAALRAFERTEDDIFLRAAGKAFSLHGLRGLLGIVRAITGRRAS